ncbi:hypothetical protein IU450_28515 [Nocardia abscessus]|uniref:hypothetical protein n=1 Tax=Nocardia abscessus TaxID=120957 RepID=UPI0018959666|nr:hypothetical protein [Nocardia abscessus]MBF6339804.1 hypothetical protein [Nocardia abscessus]
MHRRLARRLRIHFRHVTYQLYLPTWLRPAATISVFLNVDGPSMRRHYHRGAPLLAAYEYTVPAAKVWSDELMLERAFATFNGHPQHLDDHAHADAWAAQRHRSLSVGDVVAIDNRYYACERFGWARIPSPRA